MRSLATCRVKADRQAHKAEMEAYLLYDNASFLPQTGTASTKHGHEERVMLGRTSSRQASHATQRGQDE